MNLHPLVPNHEITNSKCFIWCRLGVRNPFFLSLSCTEVVPRAREPLTIVGKNPAWLVVSADQCGSMNLLIMNQLLCQLSYAPEVFLFVNYGRCYFVRRGIVSVGDSKEVIPGFPSLVEPNTAHCMSLRFFHGAASLSAERTSRRVRTLSLRYWAPRASTRSFI